MINRQIFLALGSNLGNRKTFLTTAVQCLQNHKDISVLQESTVIETAPVGEVDQGAFLNQVIEIKTNLNPLELLAVILAIEKSQGRIRTEKWGPRTLDIDILFFGDTVIQDETLQIPHPELHRRVFVLQPLQEIAPEYIHPILDLPVHAMLDSLVS